MQNTKSRCIAEDFRQRKLLGKELPFLVLQLPPQDGECTYRVDQSHGGEMKLKDAKCLLPPRVHHQPSDQPCTPRQAGRQAARAPYCTVLRAFLPLRRPHDFLIEDARGIIIVVVVVALCPFKRSATCSPFPALRTLFVLKLGPAAVEMGLGLGAVNRIFENFPLISPTLLS